MHPGSFTNTYIDITDFVNPEIVKNTTTWLSWEQNITFLLNKKIINLYRIWHNLRSYCFVVEATFNVSYPGS